MPTKWFYQRGGQTIGPLSPKELLAKVKDGEVLPQTLVRKDDSQWVEASEVGGLTEAATKDRVFHCPFCHSRIQRPPVTCTTCTRWVDFTEDYDDPTSSDEEPSSSGVKPPKVIKKVAAWVRSLMNEDDV